jgi:hypothetical protein
MIDRFHPARWLVLGLLAASLLAVPAAGAPKGKLAPNAKLLAHVSQSVAVRFWVEHPNQAPEQLRDRFRKFSELQSQSATPTRPSTPLSDTYNLDAVGLPQNEESVTACSSANVVLGGTNDYRGLLDPEFNFTGWHLSTDGGATVANEGLLPPVNIAGKPTPSGGDPVDVATGGCQLYAGSLNYDPFDPFHNPNGIGVYKSSPATLASCPGGSDPSCWPVRRAAAEAPAGHFFDKEWIDVGPSGAAGTVVWVVFSDFVIDDSAPLGFTSASIKAVRCNAALTSCTAPILISGADKDVQFSDVTVGPDGRTYITWSEIRGELEQTAQTFVHKIRVAEPGSTSFGPPHVIHRETNAIPFGGFLHANDFRVATYPKNEVKMVGGSPRIFVVWDACSARLLDTICEEPVIKLRYSDTGGAAWSQPRVLSAGGDNYFPTIAGDPTSSKLAVAWFTNRHDTAFHNAQDVELVGLDPGSLAVTARQRLTSPSNESEADPLLGGFFIGDYIEAATKAGTAYVHYNANYRQVKLLGAGFPVPQQDNFLTTAGL